MEGARLDVFWSVKEFGRLHRSVQQLEGISSFNLVPFLPIPLIIRTRYIFLLRGNGAKERRNVLNRARNYISSILLRNTPYSTIEYIDTNDYPNFFFSFSHIE